MSRDSLGNSKVSTSKKDGFRFIDIFLCQKTSSVVLSSSTKLRRKERPSSKSPRLDFDTSSSSLNLAGKNKLNVDFFEDEQNTYEYSNQLSKN